ncbi:hypothetical protein QTG54_005637 [Skeletonema marinoi]|uniref:RING-type domain-containing protein n=1 Tax=Skeletonema marinoi TaxID=267567 RepID=A0AAD8YEL7_9STRA|nr:hypothetical protein QTG54_005637 [Skeletonema marinoi]
MPVQHDVECAICCTPTESLGMKWQPCCGKHLCNGNGCLHSTCYVTTHADEDTPCPFCRAPLPKTDEEMFERIRQRVKRNDTTAISNLGNYYHNGTYGLERDALKAFELWSRAEYLGSTSSEMFYSLGIAYNSGEVVEKDAMKVNKYWQRAAMDGHVHARYNLGVMEMNYSPWRAYMHFTIAAKGGNDRSLKKTKQGYLEGFVTKDEFAETLRAYQKTTSARSTKHRDIATAHYAYERKAEEAARNGGSPYVL